MPREIFAKATSTRSKQYKTGRPGLSSMTTNGSPQFLNPNKTGGGGGWWPPFDISRDNSATRIALTMTLYDNFLLSFPHILTPHLWRPGVRFRSYITFVHARWTEKGSKCDFVYKINANWFFSLSSYKYVLFYSQWLKLICFSIIVLQKVSATNFAEKTQQKQKVKKTKKYIRNS